MYDDIARLINQCTDKNVLNRVSRLITVRLSELNLAIAKSTI